MLAGVPSGRPLSSVWWMILAAIATDAAVLGTIHVAARAGAGAENGAASGVTEKSGSGSGSGSAGEHAWARCLEGKDHEPPSIAAITYLDRGRDDDVTLAEVRGWFGRLPPAAVQVWLLEPRDPRVGRRVSFEVPADRWPAWLQPDPALPLEARCDALYDALRAHGVGRPRGADAADASDAITRSRHDFELLFPRRQEMYTAMTKLGTVADLTDARLAALISWIDAARPDASAGPAAGSASAVTP